MGVGASLNSRHGVGEGRRGADVEGVVADAGAELTGQVPFVRIQ